MSMFYVMALAFRLSHPNLMDGICWQETRHRNILNPDDVGSPSYGHCQIKEGTSTWMHLKYEMAGNPPTPKELMIPEVGLMYATLYTKFQLERYKGDLRCAISAYNGGRCLTSNQKTYVDKVLKRMEQTDKNFKAPAQINKPVPTKPNSSFIRELPFKIMNFFIKSNN